MKNIYLIKSDSYFLLNNKIEELTKDIEDVQKIDLDEQSITDVINDASYYSLFNDKKAVIITNTKYFGGKFLYEEDMDVLLNYLSNIDENTVLIFVCNEIAKTKDSTSKVLSLGGQIIDLTKLSPEELDEFINKFLSNNNIMINKKDLDDLFRRVGNNVDLLLNEIIKISIVTKNITSKEIQEYSSYNEEDVTFDFSNAIISKDFKNGFELLDILLLKGVDPVILVGLLASSYTTLYTIKSMVQDGLSDDKIIELTGFKSGRVYINKKNSRIYTLEELRDIIIGLCMVDKKIKTGSNPVYVFKEFLLNI